MRPKRIAENFDIFDFELTDDELAAIDGTPTRSPIVIAVAAAAASAAPTELRV